MQMRLFFSKIFLDLCRPNFRGTNATSKSEGLKNWTLSISPNFDCRKKYSNIDGLKNSAFSKSFGELGIQFWEAREAFRERLWGDFEWWHVDLNFWGEIWARTAEKFFPFAFLATKIVSLSLAPGYMAYKSNSSCLIEALVGADWSPSAPPMWFAMMKG